MKRLLHFAPSTAKRARQHFLNTTDPITCEVLHASTANTVVVQDAEGETLMLRDSLAAIIAHAIRENQEPRNPVTGLTLDVESLNFSVATELNTVFLHTRDPLSELARPSSQHVYQLAVDIAVRYSQLGLFLQPQILQKQRTGRMRRIAGTVQALFFSNFCKEEREQLVPWGATIFTSSLGWANWTQWAQRALIHVRGKSL